MSDQAPTAAPTTPANQANSGAAGTPGAPTPAPPPGAPQTGDVSNAAAEAMRKYKVKVEGRELEVDEKELLRGYSHQKAASKAMNEGKALRKQAESIINMLKDPEKVWEIVDKLGHDSRTLAEKRLAAHLENEMMDPRDRELRDMKKTLAEKEEAEKRQFEEIRQKQKAVMQKKLMDEYQGEFIKTLESTGLPPTKRNVGEMAGYIHRAAKIGFKMTPSEAAKLVEEDIRTAHQYVIRESDGEALLRILGEDTANKIRKYDTSKIRNPDAELRTPLEQAMEHRERGVRRQKPNTTRDWQLKKRGLK